MKLLIADDEPIIRRGIRALVDFEALGIDHIYEAADGKQAFDLFEKELPDIVLADINMPGLNGLDFSSKVKAIKPETRIALITGYDYFDYAHKAIKIGVDDYILKPVSRDDISQLLHKLIKSIQQQATEAEVVSLVSSIREDYGAADEDGYLSDIQRIVDQGFDEADFSLTVLAEGLGLSAGYTGELFKKLFKVSFKEYVQIRRLEKAKLLLLSTDMKNYEISEAIGFNDPNYFSSAFKKRFGESPNRYREKAKHGH